MLRLLVKAMPLLALVGAYFFLQKYEIDGLNGIRLRPRTEGSNSSVQSTVPIRPGDTLRIASFNIQVFGESKAADPVAIDVVARTIRMFDVVAVQEVRAQSPDFLDRFLRVVNHGGLQYAYKAGPRLGRTDSKEQYAFFYDQSRVEIDGASVYTVRDPDDLLHREPLVAGFRARNAPPNEAFTFALVVVHVDPDEVDAEMNALDDVFRAVRNDGRGEDDVILLGDFNTDAAHLGQLGAVPYLAHVIEAGEPTNTRRNQSYDNIFFDANATTEYLAGKRGVLDLVRQFNITQEQALRVSDHLPIWAEFSVFEGGRPGSVAARPVGVR